MLLHLKRYEYRFLYSYNSMRRHAIHFLWLLCNEIKSTNTGYLFLQKMLLILSKCLSRAQYPVSDQLLNAIKTHQLHIKTFYLNLDHATFEILEIIVLTYPICITCFLMHFINEREYLDFFQKVSAHILKYDNGNWMSISSLPPITIDTPLKGHQYILERVIERKRRCRDSSIIHEA